MAIGLIVSEEAHLWQNSGPELGDPHPQTPAAREISAALRLRKLQQQQANRRLASGGELPAPASILALFG